MDKSCLEEFCDGRAVIRGLCSRHYRRFQRGGRLDEAPPTVGGRNLATGVDRSHIKKPLAERFWAKVDVRGPGECWAFTGSPGMHGYGVIRDKNKQRRAHRVSYELSKGEIPEGMVVCHSCDNPPCVNPNHLFLGTVQANNRDMDRKGRRNVARGSDRRGSKLTDDLVREIRASHESNRELAARFDLHMNTIYNVRIRRTWRHVA